MSVEWNYNFGRRAPLVMNVCHYSATPNYFEFGRSARKAEKLATFMSSLSIELLSHDSCTRMIPVLLYSLLRRRLRRSSILFSKNPAFSEISDGIKSLRKNWLRRATCQPRRCLLGIFKTGEHRAERACNYQKFAVSRKSSRWILWSWDRRQECWRSSVMIREKREEKQKNKEHFIHIGPKRPRVNSVRWTWRCPSKGETCVYNCPAPCENEHFSWPSVQPVCCERSTHSYWRVSALMCLYRERVPLLYSRPTSEHLRGISLVIS